jgi:hypothetical protein
MFLLEVNFWANLVVLISCDIEFNWIKLEYSVLFVYSEFRFSVAPGFGFFCFNVF